SLVPHPKGLPSPMSTPVLQPDTTLTVDQQIDRVHAWLRKKNASAELSGLYEKLIERLPRQQLANLIAKHGHTQGFEGSLKYLDCAYWIWNKLSVSMSLGLPRSARLRVLDIAMGGGHFDYICRGLGHDSIGLDIEVPIYEE